MITHQHITRFQALWREQYSKEISSEDAIEVGVRLLRLVALVHEIKQEAVDRSKVERVLDL